MKPYQCAPLECSAHWQIITGLFVILPNSEVPMDYFTTYRDTIFFSLLIMYFLKISYIWEQFVVVGFFLYYTSQYLGK